MTMTTTTAKQHNNQIVHGRGIRWWYWGIGDGEWDNQGYIWRGSVVNIVADKSNTFTMCLPYNNSAQLRRTPKPSSGRIAYDVRMRPVHLVWAPPAHRRCSGQKPPATMVGRFFVPIMSRWGGLIVRRMLRRIRIKYQITILTCHKRD